MRRPGRAGWTLVELLAALALGLATALGAVVATTTALRYLVRSALRAEADDVAAAALEALALDVRRAGFDPRAVGFAPVVEADAARLALAADLDGDGTIDPTSEEHVTFACDVVGSRFSRIVGSQSLPLANGVTTCVLSYVDRTGTPIVVPAGGLDAAACARVGLVRLVLAVRPPGAPVAAPVTTTVALRTRP